MEEKIFQPKNNPEKEIELLQKRIAELESKLDKERSVSPERPKEETKEDIKNYLEKLQKIPNNAMPLANRDEINEIKKFPTSQQVGALVDLAMEKGIERAVVIAKGIDNPAILDEFHDILIDRHYQELIDKGIIKP